MSKPSYLEKKRVEAIQEIAPELKELVDFWGFDVVYYVLLYLDGDI